MDPLLQFLIVDLVAIAIGGLITSRVFGGSYWTNVQSNFVVMALGEAMHYVLKQRTQLADYLKI
jgi:hypothetical protein